MTSTENELLLDKIDRGFAHLDTDGDGHLSPEEFIRATIGYWTSIDPGSPANWWIGRPQPTA